MKWILLLVAVFVYAIMAWTLGLMGKNNKNVILENTIDPAHLQEPAILALAKEYRTRQWQIAAIASLLTLLLLLPLPESIAMTWFLLVLFASLGAGYFCQITYIRKLHRLIAKEAWQPPITNEILVDTQLVTHKNRQLLSLWWLTPAAGSLVAAGFWIHPTDTFAYWLMLGTAALMLLLFVGIWLGVRRLPVRPLTTDHQLNQQYNDLTKFYWSLLVIISGYLTLPLLIAPLLAQQTKGFGATVLVALFLLALISLFVVTIGLLLHLRSKQDALIKDSPTFRYRGEDQYWRWGVYYNPQDHRLLIPDRVGLGLSANLGRPLMKFLIGLLGIGMLVLIPAVTFPLYLYDFTSDPFQAQTTSQEVILTAPFTATSTVPFDNIQAVNKLSQVTGEIQRTAGYGGNRYQTGYFTVEGKAATFYLDDQSQPILQIVTKDRDYYFTSKNPQETEKIYQELKDKLS